MGEGDENVESLRWKENGGNEQKKRTKGEKRDEGSGGREVELFFIIKHM